MPGTEMMQYNWAKAQIFKVWAKAH